MTRSLRAQWLAAAAVSLLVAACGGGGGGGGGGGSNGGGSSNSTDPSITIDARSFNVSADAWDSGQIRTARVTVLNMPAAGAWYSLDGTENGLMNVDFVAESATVALMIIRFRPGAQVMPGTYRDTITLEVCADDKCTTQLRNSPITVTTSLVVSGGESSISAVEGPVSATVSKRTPPQSPPVASTAATVGNPGPYAPYIAIDTGSQLLASVNSAAESTSRIRLDATFASAFALSPGQHTETVRIKACYDSTCLRQLTGSPFDLPVNYRVTNDAPTEEGMEPVSFLSRIGLAHDVIDSEYSAQLDAIVMVSSYPRNALYLFDTATQVEREVALNKAPRSVSVSPDGLRAAVGHDALVSIVDLQQLTQSGTTSPALLNSSTVAFDIVLDGHGFVHLFPESDQWVNVHSIEIATNTETLSSGRSIYDSSRARLHPSGDFIYSANNGLSPSDIEKFEVSGGVASYLYDSPYHGDHAMCGNLWIKEDGATVYTACGNTFRSSTTQAQDMTYSGKLELSPAQFSSYSITSLSQSSETAEIALIETDSCFTGSVTSCFSHLALYESAFLNRQSVRSIAPIRVADADYAQRGLFVFHSSNGQHRYMISRLLEMPNPDTEFYLTVLN